VDVALVSTFVEASKQNRRQSPRDDSCQNGGNKEVKIELIVVWKLSYVLHGDGRAMTAASKNARMDVHGMNGFVLPCSGRNHKGAGS